MDFFYFVEKLFHSQDIQVFVFLTITRFTKSDVKMSIST